MCIVDVRQSPIPSSPGGIDHNACHLSKCFSLREIGEWISSNLGEVLCRSLYSFGGFTHSKGET